MKGISFRTIFILLTFLLSGITEGMAQTYERTFTFTFAKEDFTIPETKDGYRIIPNTSFNWYRDEDGNKPALPFIGYWILLPDGYRIKDYTFSHDDIWFDENIILAPNPLPVPISDNEGFNKENESPYPLVEYPAKIATFDESIQNGYRILDLSFNPFTYYADTRKLALATTVDLKITIEPVKEEEQRRKDPDNIKHFVYNPEDIDKGTENWEKSNNEQETDTLPETPDIPNDSIVPDKPVIPDTPADTTHYEPVDTGQVVPPVIPNEPTIYVPTIYEGDNVTEYPHSSVEGEAKQEFTFTLEGDELRIKGTLMARGYDKHYIHCQIIGDSVHLQRFDMDPESTDMILHNVDIRIPGFTENSYRVTLAEQYEVPLYKQYMVMSRMVTRRLTNIEAATTSPKCHLQTVGQTIRCSAPKAVKLEVYTMDAVKVGEARFTNGTATVTVNQVPATYLYIVTYPDGRRESGKVRSGTL